MQMYEAGQIYDLPDANGHFGPYGGVFVAETLMHALDELKGEYLRLRDDAEFQAQFASELKHYVGRPSPVYYAQRLSEHLGGAQLWLKREDLNHTGAHKINNTVGQALVAKRMGKKRVIAETGAGQHGVAAATVAARLGMECVVYMGSADIQRQAMNVYRMKLLGATVVAVESGSRPERIERAMRDWVTNVRNHLLHHRHGRRSHPYPVMVRDFSYIVGKELRTQMPGGRAPARCDTRVRGRRFQRDGCIPFLYPGPSRSLDRGRGRRRRSCDRASRGDFVRWPPGRAARQPHLPLAG
jgi:tryptophan synthase beta chain